MKIYLAVRFGSDASNDGPDGEDTNFIARASSRDEAASIVDSFLANEMPHKKVEPLCHRIIELGKDISGFTDTRIVVGPWIAYTIARTEGYKTWMREAQTEYQWKDMHEWFKE